MIRSFLLALTLCPSLLPFVAAGPPPASTCLVVTVSACPGTEFEARVSGSYAPYSGPCNAATGGRQSYYNAATEQYLFYMLSYSEWRIWPTCGASSMWANGNAGEYPFLNPAANWQCAPIGAFEPVSITCDLYDGQDAPCESGSYNVTGVAPNGACPNRCPARLPLSAPGALTAAACFTPLANLFVVAATLNRLVALNADTSDFQLLSEGGAVTTPSDITFLTPTTVAVSMQEKGTIVELGIAGAFVRTFAIVASPSGVLSIPEYQLLAVASSTHLNLIYFFETAKGDTATTAPLQVEDAVGFVTTSSMNGDEPLYLSRGEKASEILVTTYDNKVMRFCVPTSDCTSDNRIMVRFGVQNMWGIAALHTAEKDTFLVIDRSNGMEGKIYECDMEWEYNTNVLDQCDVFAYKPEGGYWDPFNVEVDPTKNLVYVADHSFNAIHVFDFDGAYLNRVTDSMGALVSPTAMAIRPGPFPSLSSLSSINPTAELVAGVQFQTALTLRTADNSLLPSDYPIENELHRYRITAIGVLPGTAVASEIQGTVNADLSAVLTINYAGNWTITATEGLVNPQILHNSPFQVTVYPAPTDPASVTTSYERVITAGSTFKAYLSTFDAFGNPTSDASFSCSCCCDSTMTVAGSYKVDVVHDSSGEYVANSPFHFQVNPGAPDAATSTHNMKQTAVSARNFHTVPLEVRVYPFDEFGNALTTSASGYSVAFSGGEGLELNLGNSFAHTYTIPAGFSGDLDIAITLDGEHVKDSPIMVTITPDRTVVVASAVGGMLLLALVVAGIFYWRGQTKIKRMASDALSMLSQNQELEDSLMKQRHSDAECEAMKKAMEEQSQERMDDLKNVLVPSGDVEILELLGQGANGKVHLAMYKGQKVAVKQLIVVDEENCMRFRFECFLTKELTHPNCVSLVGVCWDEMMLGCLLEYIDGGSMGDRIKQDWAKQFREKITWKNELLKWATECALGVQYLHHKKYYDEFEKEWKDCVVHRDLKPDNLLVTTDNVLKLTDFGEARAAELDLTMTAVGTPIYVCPEIIRNERYDASADVYSFGIVLVAMMRIEETIVDFFFDALMRKMGRSSRAGIGLNSLNINIEQGWRPLLPVEMYPSLIGLICRCWDDDPKVRPNFDEIVEILINEVTPEVRGNKEPLWGSGITIGVSAQEDHRLVDDKMKEIESQNASLLEKYMEMKRENEKVVEEIKIVRRTSMVNKEQVEKMEKELNELKTIGRGAGGGGIAT